MNVSNKLIHTKEQKNIAIAVILIGLVRGSVAEELAINRHRQIIDFFWRECKNINNMKDMWFQEDRATLHFANKVREILIVIGHQAHMS